MPDSYKNLPPDFWDDLETLKDEIARRTRAEKLTLIHCFKGGDAPPPNLAPLLDAINTAAQYPEARDTIYTALESPETINIDPTGKDTSESVSQEEAETLARNVSVMFRLLDKGYKTTIAAAIRDKAKRGTLTIGQRFVWGQLLVALTMTAERKPCDIRDFIADAFSVSLDELDTLTAETLKENNIIIKMEDEAGGYLPGMEPTPEERRALSAVRLYEQQRIQYNATALRLSSKLDRKASYFPNSGDAFHTLDIVKNKALQVKWNVPADAEGNPQRVTPYDQEVEAAISNLVDKCGVKAATYEQIYCMMNGTAAGQYISPKALEDIRRSIWKLNITRIEVFEKSDKGEEFFTKGNITDAIEHGIKTPTGQIKGGFVFSRTGLLYFIDKHYNSLLSVTREQLNISAGYTAKDGTKQKISITPLSVIIRRYLIMEIFRIRNTPSLAPTANKITYDAVIKYEADPGLVEYNTDGTIKTTPAGERILRDYHTQAEKKSIEKHRKHRRELVLAILGHFQATGLIKGFQETTEGRAKTGVIIQVEKTTDALRGLKRSEELKRLQGGGKK